VPLTNYSAPYYLRDTRNGGYCASSLTMNVPSLYIDAFPNCTGEYIYNRRNVRQGITNNNVPSLSINSTSGSFVRFSLGDCQETGVDAEAPNDVMMTIRINYSGNIYFKPNVTLDYKKISTPWTTTVCGIENYNDKGYVLLTNCVGNPPSLNLMYVNYYGVQTSLYSYASWSPFSFDTPKSENIAVGFMEGEVYFQSQSSFIQISKISPDGTGISISNLNPNPNPVTANWCPNLWTSTVSPIPSPRIYFDRSNQWGNRLIVAIGQQISILGPGSVCNRTNLILPTSSLSLVPLSGILQIWNIITVPKKDEYGRLSGTMIVSLLTKSRDPNVLWIIRTDGTTITMSEHLIGTVFQDMDIILPGNNIMALNPQLSTVMGLSSQDIAKVNATYKVLLTAWNTFEQYLFSWDISANFPTIEQVSMQSSDFGVPLAVSYATVSPAGIAEVLPVGFDLCMGVVSNSDNQVYKNIKVVNTIDDSITNYNSLRFQRALPYAVPIFPPSVPYVTQLYMAVSDRSEFSFSMVHHSAINSSSISSGYLGGKSGWRLTFSGLGSGVDFLVRDDPTGSITSLNDPEDYYYRSGYSVLNVDGTQSYVVVMSGTHTWGPNTTDGAVFGVSNFLGNSPLLNFRTLPIVAEKTPFRILVEFTSGPNQPTYFYNSTTFTSSDRLSTPIDLRTINSFTIARTSCSCGNGIVEDSEECDNGPLNGSPSSCCDALCYRRSTSFVCRPSAGPCDLSGMSNILVKCTKTM
jgi:hypothetical protein